MTKEQIEARIKELEAGRDQAKMNFLAHEGAIQELHGWLTKCEEKKED